MLCMFFLQPTKDPICAVCVSEKTLLVVCCTYLIFLLIFGRKVLIEFFKTLINLLIFIGFSCQPETPHII